MSLINYTTQPAQHVKFISYTGKYPNLCSGILTLEIDGKTYVFGYNTKRLKTDGAPFWRSGSEGRCSYLYESEWVIDVSKLPEKLRRFAAEIDKVFNDNVEHGCCGGCL